MSKKLFNESEIELLTTNEYVKKVSSKSIAYTDEFKLLFVNKYFEGESANDIFKNAGFDVNVIGSRRIKECSSRWRKQYLREDGLIDTRKNNMGRPKFNSLPDEDKVEYLKAKIEYLEQENDFLKKLKVLERKVGKK